MPSIELEESDIEFGSESLGLSYEIAGSCAARRWGWCGAVSRL